MTSKQRKREARKQTKLKIAKSALFAYFDLFNSTVIDDDSEWDIFNKFTGFLQRLQQFQLLHRESNLLDLLHGCFMSFALDWFKSQSKFISLHDFDIWFDRQSIMKSASLCEWIEILRIDFAAAAFAKSKIICSIIICMRCDSSFNFKEKLREHVREQHAKKSVNNSFFSNDTVKSVCELEKSSTIIEAFALQAPHILFTASRNQIAFEITSSKSSSLSTEALEIVSEFMKSASNQKVTDIRAICKFCEQNLNFNRELYEHIRNHEILKIVKDFHLSINAVNLICKTMRKSAVIDLFAFSVSQKFDISIATSKQKFKSVMIFEAVTSSKDFHLAFSASKIVSESIENMSTQCFTAVTCSSVSFTSQKLSALFLVFKRRCLICRIDVSIIQKHYFESSSCHEALRNRLEQQLARHAHQRKQKAQKQNSHLSINAIDLIYEIEKRSFVIHVSSVSSVKHQNSICEFTMTFRTITELKRSNLSSSTLENRSESTKKSTTCRRCNQIFNFNNKLHEHIRQHHARKSIKSSSLSVSTLESAYKIAKKSTIICSTTSFASQKSPIFSITSRSQKFWSSIIFESVIASTRSCLFFATLEIASKRKKIATFKCSFTSFTFSQKSVRKHQDAHFQKSYFIMNDLSRMFDEKSKSFDLRQHHNRRSSQQSFDIRQFDSIKSYLTIENLFEMFNEKFRRKSLLQSQNDVSSREFFSSQSRITTYFKSTVNQKSSINQDSKDSKSKNLNQHMSAKSIRTVFNNNLFEKSIKLSYKMLDVFCVDSKISFFIFILFRLLSTFFLVLAFVSIISAARMNCISVYQQVISIIDRANIELVASRRSWEETRNRMLEYSVTKHLHEQMFCIHVLLNESYTSTIACVQVSMR